VQRRIAVFCKVIFCKTNFGNTFFGTTFFGNTSFINKSARGLLANRFPGIVRMTIQDQNSLRTVFACPGNDGIDDFRTRRGIVRCEAAHPTADLNEVGLVSPAVHADK